MRTLALYVPESCFSQVWEAARALLDEETQVLMLEALAPRVPGRFFS
jgi:hypothetical protein